ncbi:hypothetical protein QE152_g24570 [Popillia japonica]|uniref:Uncharacterized protein n=1 Tax=Popillia japonica TaxID=7064 RepID=A0AAW1K2X8_POPJA
MQPILQVKWLGNIYGSTILKFFQLFRVLIFPHIPRSQSHATSVSLIIPPAARDDEPRGVPQGLGDAPSRIGLLLDGYVVGRDLINCKVLAVSVF